MRIQEHHSRPTLLAASITIACALSAPIVAQIPHSLDEALTAIFERNEYAAQSVGPTAWLDGGTRYTAVSRAGSRDLVAYDTATGTQQVLLASASLVPAGTKNPLAISNYAWSPDKSRLLIFTNTRKVWRQNTRGDY